MATLQDVAHSANVSTATASLVLSGKAEGRVSSDTQQRVTAVAKDLGYVGNAAARSLRTQKTNAIGFLSDRIASTPYAVRMIESANRVALESDQLLILVNTEGSERSEDVAVQEFLRRGVTKTVIASMFHRRVRVPSRLLPGVVVLDGYADDPSIPSIVPDEHQGTRDVLRLLIDAGHSRISYIGEISREGTAAVLRKDAYLETMDEAGLPIDGTLILEVGTKMDVTIAQIEAFLKEKRPTAVCCFNDIRAHATYSAARRIGLRIPEDLSVVGFDNQEMIAPLLDPPLTTVELPHAEMAEWAIRQLLDDAASSEVSSYPIRQRCEVVIRASIGPVAAGKSTA